MSGAANAEIGRGGKCQNWWGDHRPAHKRRGFKKFKLLTPEQLEALRARRIAEAAVGAMVPGSIPQEATKKLNAKPRSVKQPAARPKSAVTVMRPFIPVYTVTRPRSHSRLSPTSEIGHFQLYDIIKGPEAKFIQFLSECMIAETDELFKVVAPRSDVRNQLESYGYEPESFLVYTGSGKNQLEIINPL